MGLRERNLVDDFNGKFKRLEHVYPEVVKGLMNDDYCDRFFGGINSVSIFRLDQKEYLFIDTPGHGWIVNLKGKVVGEEDCGFFDTNMNRGLQVVFGSKEQVF